MSARRYSPGSQRTLVKRRRHYRQSGNRTFWQRVENRAGGGLSLPGAGWGAVAVQDFGAVGVPGGGGAVGIQDQGPAPPVDHDLVVVAAEQDAVLEAGVAAVGFVRDVVHLARGSGLVAAAGPPAALIAQDDRVADAGRDGAGGADVQRQGG